MDMCRKASVMFRAIGLKLQAEFAEKLEEQTKNAVRNRYIDFGTMTVEGCYQTGQTMAVYYDVLEPGEKKQTVEVLVNLIHKNNDHISVIYLGARVLFHVLSDFGYTDLAYKMIARPENPSYGEVVRKELTTMPECFMPDLWDCGSYNHHFFCDIKQWFLRQLAGIHVNPNEDDPNELLIKPHFASALDFAEGSYDIPAGSVFVKWERIEGNILLFVKSKGDIKFRIHLENGYAFENSRLAYYEQNQNLDHAVIVKRVL